MNEWINDSIKEGAELLTGGKKIQGQFYRPTILVNPNPKSKVSIREIFGPVLCIYTYTNIDEAVKSANNIPFAFQAGIFTNDIDEAMYLYRRLNAATVILNDHSAFREDGMPFGGLKHSGYGKGGIGYSIKDMQVEKLLVINETFK